MPDLLFSFAQLLLQLSDGYPSLDIFSAVLLQALKLRFKVGDPVPVSVKDACILWSGTYFRSKCSLLIWKRTSVI